MNLRDSLISRLTARTKTETLSTGDIVLLKEISIGEYNKIQEKAVQYTFEDGAAKFSNTDLVVVIVDTVMAATYDPATNIKVFEPAMRDLLVDSGASGIVSEIYNRYNTAFQAVNKDTLKNV